MCFIGLFLTSQVNARMLDRVYNKLAERNGGVGRPEFRLREQAIYASIWIVLRFLYSERNAWNYPSAYWAIPFRLGSARTSAVDRCRYCILPSFPVPMPLLTYS